MRLEAKNRFETKHSLDLAFLKEAIAYVPCHFRRIGICTSEGIGFRADTEAPRTSLFVSKMFLVLALVFFWYPIGTGTGCVGEVQEPDMAAARSFTGCVLPSTDPRSACHNRRTDIATHFLHIYGSLIPQ